MALNLAPFSRWTLRDKAAQRRSTLGVVMVPPILHHIFLLFSVIAISGANSIASARCVLPTPDSDVPRPSAANIEGYITSVKSDLVVIKSLRSKNLVTIRVPHNKTIYTVFGGDDSSSELRKGQKAWVWFVNCVRVKDEIPEAAYFQIFSKNPNDRP